MSAWLRHSRGACACRADSRLNPARPAQPRTDRSRSTTSCCPISPASCSTSAATRRSTSAWARARPKCERRGAARVYLDFLLKIYAGREAPRADDDVLGRHHPAQTRADRRIAAGHDRAELGLRRRSSLRRADPRIRSRPACRSTSAPARRPGVRSPARPTTRSPICKSAAVNGLNARRDRLSEHRLGRPGPPAISARQLPGLRRRRGLFMVL